MLNEGLLFLFVWRMNQLKEAERKASQLVQDARKGGRISICVG